MTCLGVPYQQWVLERVKIVKLPFSIKVPPRPASPDPVPISLKEVEDLKSIIAKLEREKEKLQSEFNKATGETMVLKRKVTKKRKCWIKVGKRTRWNMILRKDS